MSKTNNLLNPVLNPQFNKHKIYFATALFVHTGG